MWANLVKRFDLRRLWTDDAPEYADLDLALADGLVLIPTLRPDVIERYERTTGDLELDIPRPRLVALDLAENSSTSFPPWGTLAASEINRGAGPHLGVTWTSTPKTSHG